MITRDEYGTSMAKLVHRRTERLGAVLMNSHEDILRASTVLSQEHAPMEVVKPFKEEPDLIYYTLYLSDYPCGVCKRHLGSMGVGRVVIAEQLVKKEKAMTELTKRERDILPLLAQGMNNQEVAEKLYITQDTVKTLTQRMRRRAGARNSTHAVALALSKGLIDPLEPG